MATLYLILLLLSIFLLGMQTGVILLFIISKIEEKEQKKNAFKR